MPGNKTDKYSIYRIIAVISVVILLSPHFVSISEGSYSEITDDMAVDPINFEDLGDGRYQMVSEYLKETFGVTQGISDIRNPLGDGALGFTPMEIITPHRGYSYYNVHEVGGKTDCFVTDGFLDAELSVNFAAKLNIDKHDYLCQLAYVKDGDSYSLVLEAIFNEGESTESYRFDAYSANIAKMEASYIEEMVTYQSINLLQYVVADFDDDGNEDIAFQTRDNILIVGYDTKSSKLVLKATIENHHGKPLPIAPTDLVSADVDLDGVDELVILRSDYDTHVGNNESTWMGIYDYNDNKRTVWHKLFVEDPANPGSPLDAVMVSGASGDVDGDSIPELIIGGYLWDNSNHDTETLIDPKQSPGELFLTYMEMEDLNDGILKTKGTTVLRDDNDTATTRYIYHNKNFNNYKLNDHNVVDTSIYVSDTGEYGEFTRSVNWSNWTIPMASGSFRGIIDGTLRHQIYFDVGMYEFDGDMFCPIDLTPKFKHTMDGNNVICNYLESGMIMSQTMSEFDGKQSLFLSYQVDLARSYDGCGNTEVTFVIYDLDKDKIKAFYGENPDTFASTYYEIIEWDADWNPMPIISDYDYDSYVAKLCGHFFTYTDPVVLAVMAAIPYDMDLAKILKGGSDSIGSAAYTDVVGDSDTSTFTYSITAAGQVGFSLFEKLFNFDLRPGYVHDESWYNRTITRLSSKFESSHESVAAYVTPLDMYYYEVTGPSDTDPSKIETKICPVPYYGGSYCTIFSRDEYLDMVKNYNFIMKDYLGDDFTPLDVVDFGKCVEGDPSTYTYRPVDPIVKPREIYFDQVGPTGSITTTVDIIHELGKSDTNGFMVNVAAMLNFAGIKAGVNITGTCKWMETHGDLTGLIFCIKLNQGNELNYLGDKSEAKEVLSKYKMTGKMWAEKRSLGKSSYVYVGYTVETYESPIKMGSLEVNTYHPDGTDDGDPYNPTADSICLKVTIPGTKEYKSVADLYTLQIKYQDCWYDVTKIFGYKVHIDTGNEWEPSTGVFEPSLKENVFWVKVSGLSKVSDISFEFRLYASGMGEINPSVPVTGYKNTYTEPAQASSFWTRDSDITSYQ